MLKSMQRSDRRSPLPVMAARQAMQGVSMIEVMVSVLVLAIGLLGVAAMQATALRGGQSSLESTQAVIQTNAIFETMRANRPASANFNTGGMVCDAGSAGNAQVGAWINDLKAAVGTADDDTTCAQIEGCPNACVVTVRWDDQRGGGGSEREIQTETRI